MERDNDIFLTETEINYRIEIKREKEINHVIAPSQTTIKSVSNFLNRLSKSNSLSVSLIEEVLFIDWEKFLDELSKCISHNIRFQNSSHTLLIIRICVRVIKRFPQFRNLLQNELQERILDYSSFSNDQKIYKELLRLYFELHICKVFQNDISENFLISFCNFILFYINVSDNLEWPTINFFVFLAKHFPDYFVITNNHNNSSSILDKDKYNLLLFKKHFKISLSTFHNTLQDEIRSFYAIIRREKNFYENRGDILPERFNSIWKKRLNIEKLIEKSQPVFQIFGLSPLQLALEETIIFDEKSKQIKFIDNSVKIDNRFADKDEDAFYNVEADYSKTNSEIDTEEFYENISTDIDINPDASHNVESKITKEVDQITDVKQCDKFAEIILRRDVDPEQIVNEILEASRLRPDNIKFLSRLLALVNVKFFEISQYASKKIFGQIRFLSKISSPAFNSRIRVSKLAGELCKFSVVTPGSIFASMKTLISSPSSHNIIMLCHILDTCGKFLFNSPESHSRIKNIINFLFKTKNNFPQHVKYTIENTLLFSIYEVNSVPYRKIDFFYPEYEFLKSLVRSPQTKNFNVFADQLLKCLSSIDLNNSFTFRKSLNVLSKSWKISFTFIPYTIAVISKYCHINSLFVTCLIDQLIFLFFNFSFHEQKFQLAASILQCICELYKFYLVDEDIFITIYGHLLDNLTSKTILFIRIVFNYLSPYFYSNPWLHNSFIIFLHHFSFATKAKTDRYNFNDIESIGFFIENVFAKSQLTLVPTFHSGDKDMRDIITETLFSEQVRQEMSSALITRKQSGLSVRPDILPTPPKTIGDEHNIILKKKSKYQVLKNIFYF